MNVGDQVIYDGDGDIYIIEKVYEPGVYLIGNQHAFVDCAQEEQLTPLTKNGEETPPVQLPDWTGHLTDLSYQIYEITTDDHMDPDYRKGTKVRLIRMIEDKPLGYHPSKTHYTTCIITATRAQFVGVPKHHLKLIPQNDAQRHQKQNIRNAHLLSTIKQLKQAQEHQDTFGKAVLQEMIDQCEYHQTDSFANVPL